MDTYALWMRRLNFCCISPSELAMYKCNGTMLKAAMMLALILTAATHTESVGKVTNVETHFGQFDKVQSHT